MLQCHRFVKKPIPKNIIKMIKGMSTTILIIFITNQINPVLFNCLSNEFIFHAEKIPSAKDVPPKNNNQSSKFSVNITYINMPINNSSH